MCDCWTNDKSAYVMRFSEKYETYWILSSWGQHELNELKCLSGVKRLNCDDMASISAG